VCAALPVEPHSGLGAPGKRETRICTDGCQRRPIDGDEYIEMKAGTMDRCALGRWRLDGKDIMRSNNTRRRERNRKFVDSALEGTGFEPWVPRPIFNVLRLRPSWS